MRSCIRFSVARGPLLLTCLALSVIGCREPDPIRELEEPRVEVETSFREGLHDANYTILGGIAPAGNGSQWYFFKLTGPAKLVDAQRKNFDSFIASLDFEPTLKSGPWDWKPPAGWRGESRGGGMSALYRFRMNNGFGGAFASVAGPAALDVMEQQVEQNYAATFPELTVSLLGGSLYDNVNRWRKQVGLPPLKESDLLRSLEMRKVGNAVVFVTEASGPTYTPPSRNAPFANPHH